MRWRSSCRGVTLVEVLVAIAVLSVNLVGWTGALQLMIALLRSVAALIVPVDIDEVLRSCALAALLPLRHKRAMRGALCRSQRPRCGLTLTEVLVAIAMSGIVLSVLAALTTSIWRVNRDTQHRAEVHVTRVALPALLSEVVQAAGRRVSEGACGIEVADAGGRLVIRSRDPEGALVVDEVIAGRDAAGRDALYLRRLPHARQPWIEDVGAFRVVAVALDDDGRAMSLELEIERGTTAAEPLAFIIELPHRPCLGGTP